MRILLAEDNPVNAEAATRILQRRGHTVAAAATGAQVLTLLEGGGRTAFDIVLMDVQMPEMDGFTATARIRELERAAGPGAARLPVIAMTAHAMAGDRERCLAAGMDGYVSKPIDRSELFAAIEKYAPAGVAPTAGSGEAGHDRAPAAAPGGGPPPAIDEAALLANFDGDADVLIDLIAMFRTTGPQGLGELKAALARGDAPEVERLAHRLAGTVATFMAKPAFSDAKQLEMLGKRRDLGSAAALARLEERVQGIIAALECLLQRLPRDADGETRP